MSTTASHRRPGRIEPPALPAPRSLELDGRAIIKYIELTPPSFALETTPTIVLIHGSPGTCNDFRHLIPQLQPHARIIAITLPGFGDSEVVDTHKPYDHVVPLGGAKLALEALERLCKDDEHVFLVGHSFGGHTVINITAFNEELKAQEQEDRACKLQLRGIVLLASIGDRMPDSQWPIGSVVLSTLIQSELPILAPVASYMARRVYTDLLKFPDTAPTFHYASGMVRSASTDFGVVKDHLQKIAHVPAFVAWAKNDFHQTDDAFEALSEACHPGPRFAFDKGGHNIQKTQVDVLAPELTRWTRDVISTVKAQA